MVPLPAELVVGHDHQSVARTAALVDRPQQFDDVLAAGVLARIARMLVLGADRLHEADGFQPAGLAGCGEGLQELRLVTQMRGPRRRARRVTD